jgi:hypothetical protein
MGSTLPPIPAAPLGEISQLTSSDVPRLVEALRPTVATSANRFLEAARARFDDADPAVVLIARLKVRECDHKPEEAYWRESHHLEYDVCRYIGELLQQREIVSRIDEPLDRHLDLPEDLSDLIHACQRAIAVMHALTDTAFLLSVWQNYPSESLDTLHALFCRLVLRWDLTSAMLAKVSFRRQTQTYELCGLHRASVFSAVDSVALEMVEKGLLAADPVEHVRCLERMRGPLVIRPIQPELADRFARAITKVTIQEPNSVIRDLLEAANREAMERASLESTSTQESRPISALAFSCGVVEVSSDTSEEAECDRAGTIALDHLKEQADLRRAILIKANPQHYGTVEEAHKAVDRYLSRAIELREIFKAGKNGRLGLLNLSTVMKSLDDATKDLTLIATFDAYPQNGKAFVALGFPSVGRYDSRALLTALRQLARLLSLRVPPWPVVFDADAALRFVEDLEGSLRTSLQASERELESASDLLPPVTKFDSPSPVVNGPQPPNLFWWNETKVELPPIPWRLVNVLWIAANQSMESDDLSWPVWGTDEWSEPALKSAMSKANTAFVAKAVPVVIRQKSGRVMIEVQSD